MTPEQMIEGYKAATTKEAKDIFANDFMCRIIKTPICNQWKFTLNELPDEIWVPVKDFENCYEISNYGRLKHLAWETEYEKRRGSINKKVKFGERICEYSHSGNKYARTTLLKGGINYKVNIHVLVAQHFIPNPDNLPEVNHKNGKKRNNHYLNLEWSTHLDNVQHSIVNGLKVPKGLNAEDVILIFKMAKPLKEIANMYGISKNKVWGIKSGKNWGLLTGKKYIPKMGKYRKKDNI